MGTKTTRQFRMRFGMGLTPDYHEELLLIENVKDEAPEDRDTWNHFHGNPKKYRLQNLTQDHIDAFFKDYERGALPTYWITNITENPFNRAPSFATELGGPRGGDDFEKSVL